jgi:hypothetical protein
MLAAAALASPLAAVPALAGITTGSHPDAALLALGETWRSVRAEYDAHFAAMEAAHDRYEATRPPLPEALLQRSSDRGLGLPEAHWDSVGRGWPEGSPCYFSTFQVEDMEETLKRGDWTGEKRTRAEEIVAAFDVWNEADQAALEASGYEDDSPEKTEVSDRHAEAVWEIAQQPARTMAGLLLKAEVSLSLVDGGGDPETMLTDAAEGEGLSENMVALFIVRDLLALAQRDAAYG